LRSRLAAKIFPAPVPLITIATAIAIRLQEMARPEFISISIPQLPRIHRTAGFRIELDV